MKQGLIFPRGLFFWWASLAGPTYLASLAWLAYLAPPIYSADSGWLPGEVREAFVGGEEIHRRTQAMLEAAKTSIEVEMYTFGDWKFADVLAAKHRQGVAVRVILDRTVEVNRAMKRYLKSKGIPVVFYPTEQDAIDHVKLVLVDGGAALLGGANWGEHSPKNFDVAVQAGGQAAKWLRGTFEEDWKRSQGEWGIQGAHPAVKPKPTAGDCRMGTDWDIRALVIDELNRAKTSIDVAMYVLTDREMVSEFIDAHRRGLKVRVLLDPGEEGKNFNRRVYEQLSRAKVPVKWYAPNREEEEKFHIKMVCLDGRRVILGSANLTFRGLKSNHECDIVLANVTPVQRCCQAFDHVWARGRTR